MYSVAIIDDEKWVIKSLRATLSAIADIEVIGEAYNGTEGIRLIEKRSPDIAFVDVRMPEMGGLELLQAADEAGYGTLFIMISGHAEFAYAQKAIFHNAIGYCLKPFSKSEIAEAVEKGKSIIDSRVRDARKPAPSARIVPSHRLTKNNIVNEMLSYIDTHFAEDISIRQLADIIPINANYASQLFSRHMNETFSQYLAQIRIREAARLLTETNMPIGEVASSVGYRDYYYFTKVFKKLTGCTPSQYQHEADKRV